MQFQELLEQRFKDIIGPYQLIDAQPVTNPTAFILCHYY